MRNKWNLFAFLDMNYHDENPFDLSINRKMFDIIDAFDQSELINDELHLDNYLPVNRFKTEENQSKISQWEIEEYYLKHESNQLSPNDYLTRTSLYNRPVAFEKDSRSWARSLLNNFKKTSDVQTSNILCPSSTSFDRHIQYIEHLNECNDYPAYLEYLKDNRTDLFLTLTDSIDLLQGLLGTCI